MPSPEGEGGPCVGGVTQGITRAWAGDGQGQLLALWWAGPAMGRLQ